jgi:uncharacterized protein (DUF2141 family)
MFFFEKKNQKTFDYAVAPFPSKRAQVLKGCCFFFSKKKFLLPWFFLSSAQAAPIQIDIDGVRNSTGSVLVAICPKADFLRATCPWRGRAAARPGRVRINIADVPPGIYAAQAFHDENDNGLLDRNFIGMPREAMGFSNDAPMHMGPPEFDAAAFSVGAVPVSIVLRLRYF